MHEKNEIIMEHVAVYVSPKANFIKAISFANFKQTPAYNQHNQHASVEIYPSSIRLKNFYIQTFAIVIV